MTIRPKNNHTNRARSVKVWGNTVPRDIKRAGLPQGYKVQRAKPRKGPENIVVNFANLARTNDASAAQVLAGFRLEEGEELEYSHNLGATYYFLIKKVEVASDTDTV